MIEQFAPYELALELKRVGFNEPCLAWYNPKGTLLSDLTIGYEEADFFYTQNDMDENQCIAPTYSQAFRWFREKYNLRCQINYIGGLLNKTTWWDISVIGHYNTDPQEWEMKYQPYEEAETACLRKLIEIVKTK